MKAIILAGGEGVRMQHLFPNIPKPMIQACGRPFLEYVIYWLKSYNITDIILSVYHMKEKIENYFLDGSNFGVNIKYSADKGKLGTGGAIKNALQYIEDDETVLVLNGDTLFLIDLNDFILDFTTRNSNNKALCYIAFKYFERCNPRFGVAYFDDNMHVIGISKRFVEGDGYINGGIYLMKGRLKYMLNDISSFENDLFTEVIPDNIIVEYFSNADFIDMGVPEDYYTLCQDLKFLKKIMNLYKDSTKKSYS